MMWNKNCDSTKKSGKYCPPPPKTNKQTKEMPYLLCITNSRSINKLQTAKFFTFEIAKLLAGVAHTCNMLYTFLQEHAVDLVMSKNMSNGDVFIRGEIWLWGERLLYEEGEILL